MPDAIIRESTLWAPVRHARHPSVWCFLLAAIEPEMTQFQLRFDAIYHYKRYSEEVLSDDGSPETRTALIRVENLAFFASPVLELPGGQWQGKLVDSKALLSPSDAGATLPA